MKSIFTVFLLTICTVFAQTTPRFKGIQLDGAPTTTAAGTMYYDPSSGILRARNASGQWVNASQSSPFWYDTFTGTDTTVLDHRVGERGSLQKMLGAAGSSHMVIDNDGGVSVARGNAASTVVYAASTTPASADYSVSGDIIYKTSNGAFLAVGGRFDYATQNVGAGPTGSTGYIAGYDAGANQWNLLKVITGTATSLGTYSQTLSTDTSYNCRLEMIGTTQNVYINNVLRISAANTQVAGPGRAVIWSANASTRTTGLHLNSVRADDGEIAPPVTNDTALVWQGDSIIGGFPNSYELTIPQRVAKRMGVSTLFSFQADAKLLSTVVAEDATTMAVAYAAAAGAKSIVAINQTGVNDLNAGVSAATILTDLQTWNANQKALGVFTVNLTIPKATLLSAGEETQRGLLNAGIPNAGADMVIDVAAHPMFSDTSNSVIFHDGTHYTAAGKQVEADIVADALTKSSIVKNPRFDNKIAVSMDPSSSEATRLTLGASTADQIFNVYEIGGLPYGFGARPFDFRTYVANSSSRFSWNAAPDAANGSELMTLSGTGTLTVKGLTAPAVQTSTLAASASTLAITRNVLVLTGDAGGNSISTFTGAIAGSELTIIFIDNHVTIVDDDAGTTNSVNLAGTATNFVSTQADVIKLLFSGTKWFEVSRSVN